ncbi:MAG: hypothetical protein EXS05_17145 [Planctomycetaceae bacterium]|nr:hypothetical protein [Planctomycetaceae bacterium]
MDFESNWHALILGAGFSAPFGLPVMRQFMGKARRLYFANHGENPKLDECYEAMFCFEDQCQAASRYFNRDWENIEELYTQADLRRLMFREQPAEDLCRRIAWAIWDVYRQWSPKQHPPIHDLLTFASSDGLNPAIITTNYDVLCEIGKNVSMRPHEHPKPSEQGWRYYYPGFCMPWNSEAHELSEDERLILLNHRTSNNKQIFPIIKLHGSVNWFQKEPKGPYVALTSVGDTQGMVFGVNEKQFRVDAFDSPAIVPPMLGKASGNAAIAAQWKAAVKVLSRARRVTVIGYSFPQTDAFMLRLLSEGLKDNADLEQFCVIDKRPFEEWAPLLSRFFTPVARDQKLLFIHSTTLFLLNYIRESGLAERRPPVEGGIGLKHYYIQ